MLGLYFIVGLPVVVLLGKGKVLGHSRSKLSCLYFGVHRGRNMKHNGGVKSCKRKAAPNVTRPCDHHSHRRHPAECPAAAGDQQGLLMLSGGFQEAASWFYFLLKPSFDTILNCRASEVMWPSPLGALPGTGLCGTSGITLQWVPLQHVPQCSCPPQCPRAGMPEAARPRMPAAALCPSQTPVGCLGCPASSLSGCAFQCSHQQ